MRYIGNTSELRIFSQIDNGSEFAKYFIRAAQLLNLIHYHSRIKTPKDNAFDERFNRTLEDEFIALGHLTNLCAIFNKELKEWLIEHNFYYRLHQSPNFLTSIQFGTNYLQSVTDVSFPARRFAIFIKF
jgi:transposase InsO family protein